MDNHYVLCVILVLSVITFVLRAIPFLLPKQFFEKPLVAEMAKVMPLLIMVTLVLHAFDDVTLAFEGPAVPLLIGIAAVAGLHLFLKRAFLSIVGGVAVYIGALMLFAA